MRKLFIAFAFLFMINMALGQNVGIGATLPVAKLDIRGAVSNPSIPDITSTGTFRIGVAQKNAMDMGKMGTGNHAGWIQVGENGTSDPLSLQPLGGNVGIGTTTPGATLEVAGLLKIAGGTPGVGKVLTSDAAGLASWVTPATPLINYPFVTICTQQWMDKNLDVTTYRNGDPITYVTDPAVWAGLTTGAWCYYNNDPSNNGIYGKLYNWYAVADPRGLAPTGWHVPSDAEWTTLSTCLGGDAVAGGKMKVSGTTTWLSPNTAATNTSGFAGLPGSFRDDPGTFDILGEYGTWWSSTEGSAPSALMRFLHNTSGSLNTNNQHKQNGFSVRCLKD